ncbi:MAG: hypothetical protein GY803_21620 [Chloroflexi bacterium]|nr:hypothetical protein [Chloroflexota bacterium]
MDSKLDSMWQTYNTVQEGIRHSDTKAEAVVGIVGVVTGIMLSALAAPGSFLFGQRPFLFIILILGVISGAVSIYFAIRCLSPTLDVGEPTSLLFFGHVAKLHSTAVSYQKAVNETFTSDDDILEHLTSEVWANSKIAWKKFKLVAWAIRFLVVTIFIALAGVLVAAI